MALRVRILVADAHELVRRGVRAVLEDQSGWTICGEAATGPEAVARAIALQPDVVVLDADLPALSALEATQQIRRAGQAEVLVLTAGEPEQVRREAVDAGARGCISKADAGRTLVEAVRALLPHREFLSNAAGGGVPGRQAGGGDGPGRLTPREREVLQLLAEGKANKEVAAALGMSTKTAETHRARIMAKLALHSVGELVRYAIRNHIIEP